MSILKKLSIEIAEHTPDEVVQFMHYNENRDGDPTFPCLDEAITKDEIQTAIKRPNTNKSSGFDNINNKYFKNAAEVLIEPLRKLFNKILNSRSFPMHWAVGMVVPIRKKRKHNVNNYRGITLKYCRINKKRANRL